eukprot:50882_1
MSTEKIEKISSAFKKYYSSKYIEYTDFFSEFCYENGIEDDDALEEELLADQDPADCILVDFDDHFPFDVEPKNDTEKQMILFRLITKYYEEDPDEDKVWLPSIKIDEDLFNLDEKELEEIKKVVKKQCPIYELHGDPALFIFMAIEKKKDYPYLQYLLDSYHLHRIEQMKENKTSLTESQWIDQNKNTQKLKQIKVSKNYNADDLLHSAMVSFGKRHCPKLIFKCEWEIKQAIEYVVKWVAGAINFVSNQLQVVKRMDKNIYPFQFDFAIIIDTCGRRAKQVDPDDDDDDDDDDEKLQTNDYFGNIKNKLKKKKKSCKRMIILVILRIN